jgi:hypothetical protein
LLARAKAIRSKFAPFPILLLTQSAWNRRRIGEPSYYPSSLASVLEKREKGRRRRKIEGINMGEKKCEGNVLINCMKFT